MQTDLCCISSWTSINQLILSVVVRSLFLSSELLNWTRSKSLTATNSRIKNIRTRPDHQDRDLERAHCYGTCAGNCATRSRDDVGHDGEWGNDFRFRCPG